MQKVLLPVSDRSAVLHRWLGIRLACSALLIPVGFSTAFIALGTVFDPNHGFIGQNAALAFLGWSSLHSTARKIQILEQPNTRKFMPICLLCYLYTAAAGYQAFYLQLMLSSPEVFQVFRARAETCSLTISWVRAVCQNQLVLWFHHHCKKVYNNGAFEGHYDQIHSDIKEAMALAMNLQTPDQMLVGVANTEFESEIPSKI